MGRHTLINLYHADCMEFMADKPDNCYDLAIVDPPYGLERYKKKDGGNSKKIKSFGDKDKEWNNTKPNKMYFDELFRISKYQIIWGCNNFVLPISEYFIVWDKKQMMPSFARCELAWTNKNIPAKICEQRTIESEYNKIHPTQKPKELYRWLLKNYAKKGDKILDTHGGSMSIAIACHDMGFDLDLCELDKDYFEAGKARYEKHISQMRMF